MVQYRKFTHVNCWLERLSPASQTAVALMRLVVCCRGCGPADTPVHSLDTCHVLHPQKRTGEAPAAQGWSLPMPREGHSHPLGCSFSLKSFVPLDFSSHSEYVPCNMPGSIWEFLLGPSSCFSSHTFIRSESTCCTLTGCMAGFVLGMKALAEWKKKKQTRILCAWRLTKGYWYLEKKISRF